jgi:LAS superfamily LD-carboxypeptidase LdcB
MLWDGYVKRLPGFNLAAKPGNSNHQNGIAIDIAVAGADGNEVYEWLKLNAPRFGFVRTVSGEPWHWEHDPIRAQQAVQNGTYKIPSVTG